ncbi:MAG TPA: YciI family protein [Tepidisphaeraceae bacterium]|nr:YciI family protein [Tepidisphaeraceae bacterium]
MKYLCLGYHDENALRAMTPLERIALFDESRAYNDRLRRTGHFVEGKSLQGRQATITLRFEKGHVSVAEGPFARSKEQLGGLMVLEARDLNQAIQLLSQLPSMRPGGCLEIRPIEDCSNTGEDP